MFIKVWDKKTGISTSLKIHRIKIITKGTPPFQHITFRNIIDGRAYIDKYNNGYFSVIVEIRGIKGISDWSSLVDEAQWANEVLGKAESIEVEVPDRTIFPLMSLSFLGGLKSIELLKRRKR